MSLPHTDLPNCHFQFFVHVHEERCGTTGEVIGRVAVRYCDVWYYVPAEPGEKEWVWIARTIVGPTDSDMAAVSANIEKLLQHKQSL